MWPSSGKASWADVVVLHEIWHLIGALALIAASVGMFAVVRNDVIRRRLRFTLWTVVLYVGVHLAGEFVPGLREFAEQRLSLERLLFVLAIVSGVVSLFNPWFRHGVPDRLPSILQDTIVLAVFAGVAVGWFHSQLSLTSAVGAAVIGIGSPSARSKGW